MRKKIYIAYTGGTIGMKRTGDGYRPVPGHLGLLMAQMMELKDCNMPEYTIHEYEPLIDSSDISPSNWLSISRDIADNYKNYDGFIVLHGTDTMAYTASALSFMLEDLNKPVILTGAQIPLCEIRNDARENIITTMQIAGHYHIPEVCLYFGSRLMRGNRSVKVDAESFEAFDSPNFPYLGEAGIHLRFRWNLIKESSSSSGFLKLGHFKEQKIAALRLFPGISADAVEKILETPIRGLVLETYGVGNAPSHDKKLLKVIESANCRGVVIVNCTQCMKGSVQMEAYSTGRSLSRTGVISGGDMTAEAALTKMFYLFSQDLSPDEIKKKMQENLRGELSVPPAR